MPSVTIDTGVLAVPSMEVSSNDARNYVETLLDWKQLLKESWISIYMSEKAPEILFDSGLYPLRDALGRLFIAKGIIEYDVNTVARVIDTLLQVTPSFETYFKVHDALASTIQTEPDILSIYTPKSLSSDFARCLILFGLLRKHCRNPILDHALVIKPCLAPKTVQVRALVHCIDHSRDDIENIPIPPEYFRSSVWICQTFKEFVSDIDDVSIWNSAQDDVGLRIAIQIALYKSRMQRGLGPEWTELSSSLIGSEFARTARECCRTNPPSFVLRVLRSLVETIEHIHLEDTHALRIGQGGNAPQRSRGIDKAWRRDIDRQYHLHYWESPTGKIELASIVVHNDFSIPDQ